jgi:biopolymer transport protein ExbD/biopolymer transport protein TolR
MAFEIGTKRKVRPQMNVTPLVDVVLVLLIIFMVITPLMNKMFWVNIPKDDKKAAQAQPPEDSAPVVVHLDRQGRIHINGLHVPDDDFGPKLLRIFAARDDRVLFFDAMDRTHYGRAVQVMDLARGSGATTIAILTEALAESE